MGTDKGIFRYAKGKVVIMLPALAVLNTAVAGLTALVSVWAIRAEIAYMIAVQVANNAAAWGAWMEDTNLSTSEAEKDRIVGEALVKAVCGVSNNIAKIGSSDSNPVTISYAPLYTPLLGHPIYNQAQDSRQETIGKAFVKIFSGYTAYTDLINHIDNIPIANIAEKIENLRVNFDARMSFYDPNDERVKGLAEIVWEIANRPGGAGEGLTYEQWKELLDSYFMVEVGQNQVSISDLIISLLNHGNFLYY